MRIKEKGIDIQLKAFIYILFMFLIFIIGINKIYATSFSTIHFDSNTTNEQIYGKFLNDYNIVLDSNVKVKCFSSIDRFYSFNTIANDIKTLDLNGYTLDLGCPLLLNAYNDNGTINIIDSSEKKTGKLKNEIYVKNCFDDGCRNFTINIEGGIYNSSTFLSMSNKSDKVNVNINNIKFIGNTFLGSYLTNLNIKNVELNPLYSNLNFMSNLEIVKIQDIIDENYKVISNNNVISLSTNANDLNVENSNIYIAKNVELLGNSDFQSQYFGYNANIENIQLIIKNDTQEELQIKSIYIDSDEFELTLGSDNIVIAPNSILTTDYSLSPKTNLTVGQHKTNIIFKDINEGLYVSTMSFEVLPISVSKPILNSNTIFEYNKLEQGLNFMGFNDDSMELLETKTAINVGEYVTKIKLKEGYCWEDGTTEELVFNWKINFKPISKPVLEDNLYYTGTEQEVNFNGFNEEVMELKGRTSAFYVGEYVATIKLKEGYCWEDGTTEELEFNWKINNNPIKKPTLYSNTIFKYDGKSHQLDFNGYDENKMQLRNRTSAISTGDYYTTIKPKDGYCWEDGTTEELEFNWKIYDDIKIIGNDKLYINNEYSYKVIVNPKSMENDIKFVIENDTGSATIDENGILTPITNGNVFIKVLSLDESEIYKTKEILISEQPIIENFVISSDSYHLDISRKHKLNLNVYPDMNSNLSINWSTSNKDIATIDEDGVLTPLGVGVVTVSATIKENSNYYDEIELVIYNPENTILIEKGSYKVINTRDNMLVVRGEKDIISYTDTSYKCGERYCYNYYLTGKKIGTTTISTFPDEIFEKSVIVYPVVNKVNINEIILEKNDIFNIDNINSEFQTYFSSSNSNVATIDSNGRIIAKNYGNAEITIFTKYGKTIVPLSVVENKNDYEISLEKINIIGESNLKVGNNYCYSIETKPLNANKPNIEWSVENITGSATIDENGVLTPKTDGTVKIKATAIDESSISAEKIVELKTYYDVEKISIKAPDLYLENNTSIYLSAMIYPQNATIKDVIWSSSDTTIATINPKTGGLTTKNKTGKVTITAKATDGSGIIGSIDFIVGYTAIKINQETSLGNSNMVYYDKVEWVIEDESIVSKTGKVTTITIGNMYKHIIGVKGLKNGETTIKMQTISGDIISTSKLYVYTPIKSLESIQKTIEMEVGETSLVDIKINPINVSNNLKDLIYVSEDNSIATIDETGKIIAHKLGSTNIIVYSKYSDVSVTIPVNVVQYATDLKLNSYNVSLNDINKTHKIEYEITPSNVTDNSVTFKSTDESIIVVSSDGIITALKNGNAKVIVTTGDKKQIKEVNVTVTGLRKSIENLSFSNIQDYDYTSNEITPSITITDNEYTLINGTDYTVTYENNIEVGKGTIIIYGINNYKDSKVINFNINKAQPNIEYTSSNKSVIYDGNFYGINLEIISPENVVIKYANELGEYILDEMPKYNEIGVYNIKYQLSINSNYNVILGENTLFINKKSMNVLSDGYEGIEDGNDHTITLDIKEENYTVKYSVDNMSYNLSEKPKFRNPGYYTVFYKITSPNFEDFWKSETVKIYGIKSLDSTLKLKNNVLILRNYTNVFSDLKNKIDVYALTSSWQHLSSLKETVDNEVVKTGEYVQLNINNEKTFEYQMAVLGDVNSDGKVSALDYVKIKNHIMGVNKITNETSLISADVNEDDKVSALDYVRIKNHIMNGGN